MRTGYVAIGLAAVVAVVPASFALDSQAVNHGKAAGTGIEAEGRTQQGFGGKTGISLAVPIGRVSVDSGAVGGEPIYERRVTVRGGITIVEVSTTPFAPPSNEGPGGAQASIVRPDQPAPW